MAVNRLVGDEVAASTLIIRPHLVLSGDCSNNVKQYECGLVGTPMSNLSSPTLLMQYTKENLVENFLAKIFVTNRCTNDPPKFSINLTFANVSNSKLVNRPKMLVFVQFDRNQENLI